MENKSSLTMDARFGRLQRCARCILSFFRKGNFHAIAPLLSDRLLGSSDRLLAEKHRDRIQASGVREHNAAEIFR
jgi:hypothetical protein